jgi:hypothetical protein
LTVAGTSCPDCGLVLPEGRGCRDLFYEMLAIEAQIPGGPTALGHFFAVASFNLQHPSLFVPAAIPELHRALRDALEGRADVAELRRRAGRAYDGFTRVVRRADDPGPVQPPAWPVAWPITVGDVCRVDPAHYDARAREWAESIVAVLRKDA